MKTLAAGTIATLFLASTSPALLIEWNYDYDSSGFFATTERQAVLDAVAAQFDHVSIDSPDIMPPGGIWTWKIINPTTGAIEELNGSLSAGTVTIYVGAQDLGNTALGLGGPSGYSLINIPPWDAEVGALNTDAAFKPFAGTLTINNSSDLSWYDGLDDTVPLSDYDLFSVVTHELAHILGIGTSTVDAWIANQNADPAFIGANATALYGGSIPLTADGGHFDNVLFEGKPLVTNEAIFNGQRLYWSELETAVLQDLGYVVIPEPGSIGLLAFGGGVFLWSRFRRRQAA